MLSMNTSMPTRKTLLSSEFMVSGQDINARYKKNSRWILKNALREINQKRIKEDKIIKALKKKQEIKKNGIKRWICPHCKIEVANLTSAHCGTPVADIIDKLLDENPDETNFHILYEKLIDIHNTIPIVVCCRKCNAIMDDKRNQIKKC